MRAVFCDDCGKHISVVQDEEYARLDYTQRICSVCKELDPNPQREDEDEPEADPICHACGETTDFNVTYSGATITYSASGDGSGDINQSDEPDDLDMSYANSEVSCANCGSSNVEYSGSIY
jgi:hypothetical protein